MTVHHRFRNECIGGVEASIQGLATSIGPLLLFAGLFGSHATAAGFWATLVTASVVHGVSLIFRGQPAIVPCARVASLAAYCGLIVQLGHSVPDPTYTGSFLSPLQFRMGYTVGSALFLTASLLVFLSGILRIGNVFKMIPTPVTAGIGNGTALLLVWLAFVQISHHTWLGLAPALSMLASYLYWPVLQKRFNVCKPIPSAFFAVVIGMGLSTLLETPWQAATTHSIAIDTQWVPPVLWSEFPGREFGRLFVAGLPGCLTLALVMILETFTTASIMETRFGVRADPNRELLVMGGSNIFSALLGGAPSTGSPVRSLSNWQAGGRTRVSSFIALVVTTALIVLLSSWLSTLPAGVIAGLFLMQSTLLADRPFLRQLIAWAGSLKRRETSAADMGFSITGAISLIAFFGNLVWASFLGIALSSLLVLRRLSGNLTARWAYLDQYSSRRIRSSAERANLDRMHKRVGVLRLTGHLFFGNSVRIVQLVDELHTDAIAAVIDVSQVTDVDPSGLAATQWVIRALLERKVRVVVSGLKRTRANELLVGIGLDPNVRYQVDLDRGLEFCEDFVLMHSTILTSHLAAMPLEKNRLLEGLSAHEITSVLMLGEMHEFEKESIIFKRDTIASGIWLLEEGKVSILSHDQGTAVRLATLGPGQFVGEMGFIDGKLRSATAMADTPVRAMLLDNDAIAALMQQEPAAVLAITRNIARELSLRVRSSSALIADETSDESHRVGKQCTQRDVQVLKSMAVTPTLNIVGGGRVGQTLARLWRAQGVYEVQGVVNTAMASAQRAVNFIGAGQPLARLQDLKAADVWMLSVPDAQIAEVALALAPQARPALAFHCSGARGSDALAPLRAAGWATASAHCILSFATAEAAFKQFSGTPCALEGDAIACAALQKAFNAIGARCFGVRSEDKLRYHAAAVFATNFLPVLQSVAEDLWRDTGVPTEVITTLRSSLLHNAIANITALGPRGALTGPAARGDVTAIALQGAAVSAWNPQAGAAYDALSHLALELARRSNGNTIK